MSGDCGLSWVGATRRKTESTVEIQWTGKLIGEKMRMSFPDTFSGKQEARSSAKSEKQGGSDESLRRKEMLKNSQQELWRVNQPKKCGVIVELTTGM